MKSFIILLWLGLAAGPAYASSPVDGIWQYDGFIYQGQRFPNPNPNLFLTFTFKDGISRLYWRRLDENGFCERKAEFRTEDNQLFQTVTWVNPSNNSKCAQDPDMRSGPETEIEFRVEKEYLELYFEIRGERFTYLLKHIGCVFE